MNRFILFCLFVTIIFSTSYGQYTSAELDSFIVAKMAQYHFPGLQACIVNKDSVLWKGNYGYANIAQNKMIDDSTLFIIESISKPVTATAVMQLWEQGLFGLDDDVNDYLPFTVRNPSFPNDSITFRMLLSHSSSITENWTVYPTPDDLITWNGDSPISLRSYLEGYLIQGGSYYTVNSWDNHVPGSRFNYSSAGVALLGYLVEIIANTSFETYCQNNIFGPLEMYETSWFLANLDVNTIATPYVYSNGSYLSNQHWGEPNYPSGQIRTNALQLAHFIIAFIQKGQFGNIRILQSATVDSMTTVQNPQLYHCGLTWFISQQNFPHNVGTKTMCAHTGTRRFGANTGMGFILNEDIGAIILTNGDYGNAEPGIIEIALELISYGVISTTTEVGDESSVIPEKYYLSQNYPNPFNPSTTIEFQIPSSQFVTLKIYNLLGQEVATLVSDKLSAGNYKYDWDAGKLASGVYLYKLQVKDNVKMKKMILLR